MDLQRTRLFLIVSLLLIGMMLFSEWQREHATPASVAESEITPQTKKEASDIPAIQTSVTSTTQSTSFAAASHSFIEVVTDVFKIKIDTEGGDIVSAELIKYPQTLADNSPGEIILTSNTGSEFIAQMGLIGRDERGPDSRQLGRAHYHAAQTHYQLGDNNQLKVELFWQDARGLKVIKSFVFNRASYLVDVNYHITNATDTVWQGSMYGQLRREYVKKSSGMFGVQVYQGAALYTPEKPYKKLSFSDMKKHPFREQIQGGWAAFLDHYFLCAFIPAKDNLNHYYTRLDENEIYNIGATTAVEVSPQGQQDLQAQFYIGPEIIDTLKGIAKGLDLTIDYGILWPISSALFWLLKNINHYVGNWGWSIIFVTLIIKLLFYKLSAASYRSMGQMRNLQPRIETLKARFGDDKQQFSAALMEMYKKEKINPLGGCLPILIQIPVFIALYYVLLESIELRHAPFILWIKDLSNQDPYYVLPLIMGATMFLQQKMNPTPPDPMQAKVMMFMPVIFTVLFFSFPAGLVLYWTVNNVLSMLQQWYISRTLERDSHSKTAK